MYIITFVGSATRKPAGRAVDILLAAELGYLDAGAAGRGAGNEGRRPAAAAADRRRRRAVGAKRAAPAATSSTPKQRW